MRSWTFSCADFTFPLLPHERALQLIHLLDVPAVDIGLFSKRSHITPEHLANDLHGTIHRVRTALAHAGVDVSDVFLQTGEHPPLSAANTPDPQARAHNRRMFDLALEFAAGLDCRHVTGLPGVRHADTPASDDWQRAIDEAAWRTDRAKSAGLVYAVEAHVGSITPDPVSAQRLLDAVPDLTLTLDYGHFIYAGLSDADVHPLLPRASHLHVRGGAPGRLQIGMSRNTINFTDLARRLDQLGYPGYVCLEYVWIDWQGCNESDNVSETLVLKQMMERS